METDHETRALLMAVRRVARAFDIQSRRIDRALGLTIPQYVVLTCVAQRGEATSRAIAEEADLSPPTVVGVLDKLEAKGLVVRRRSERDRRIVHTRLTERGRAALDAAPAPLGPAFAARFAALPAARRGAILAALAELGGLFGEDDALADAAAPPGPS